MFKLLTTIAITSFCVAQSENQDSIILKDGGLIYGDFEQFITESSTIKWSRNKNGNPLIFNIKEVSQISFNGSRPKNNSPHNSYILLINGDRIPCDILSLNENLLKVKTQYSGELEINKNQIKSLHPTPNGAPLIVNGFGSQHNWQQKQFTSLKLNKSDYKPWELHGAAFYAKSGNTGYITNPDIKLPDDFVCVFNYSFMDFPTLNVVLNADFQKKPAALPDKVEEDQKDDLQQVQKIIAANANITNNIGSEFGNCLHLTMHAGRAKLYSAGIDKETGEYFYNNLDATDTHYIRVNPRSNTKIELHISRNKRMVRLFLNEKSLSTWHLDKSTFPKNGNQLAFYCKPTQQSSSRLSNLRIAKWHGNLDSPKSLVNEEKDIIILSNNTDRFAGSLENVNNEGYHFENELFSIKVPTDDVKQINFSTNQLSPSQPQQNKMTIDFYNSGVITGSILHTTDKEHIVLKTQYADQIKIPTEHIRSIRLEDISSLLESWQVQH